MIFVCTGNSFEMIAYKHLTTDLLNNTNITMVFTTLYTISCFFMTLKWVSKLGNRFLMKISFSFLVVALIFVSREQLFGLPKDLEYIVVGMVLSGIFNSPAAIVCMPEILVYGRQAAKEGSTEQVDDMITSIFIQAMAMGEFIGPMLVSHLFVAYSYEIACYVL